MMFEGFSEVFIFRDLFYLNCFLPACFFPNPWPNPSKLRWSRQFFLSLFDLNTVFHDSVSTVFCLCSLCSPPLFGSFAICFL